MNRLSLTFKDEAVELKFQAYQTPIYKQSLQHAFMIGSLIHLAAFIILIKYNSYLLMGLCAMGSCQYSYLYYRVRSQNEVEKILLVFFNVVLIVTPYFIYLFIIYGVSSSSTQCVFIIYSQIYIQSAIMSQNLLLTSFQFANSLIMLVAALNQAFGSSEYQYLIILYFYHWLQQEYQKIKTNRTNFISSQINESLYEIMTKTQEYPLYIFTYDQERNEYKMQSTQNDFNLPQFLKTFHIDNKITLSQYIFQEFIQKKQSDFKKYELSGFIPDKAYRQKIQLFVQSYPEIKFVLRIIKSEVIKCPDEILYEQKLIDNFIKKSKAISKRSLLQFTTLLYTNRLVYLYKFKQISSITTQINFNKVLASIARQCEIDIYFTGSLQYQGDLLILQQVLTGIIILVQNNKILFCTIKNDINQVLIQITTPQLIQNWEQMQKTQFINHLNYLIEQFSFNKVQLTQDSIQFCILTDKIFQFR